METVLTPIFRIFSTSRRYYFRFPFLRRDIRYDFRSALPVPAGQKGVVGYIANAFAHRTGCARILQFEFEASRPALRSEGRFLLRGGGARVRPSDRLRHDGVRDGNRAAEISSFLLGPVLRAVHDIHLRRPQRIRHRPSAEPGHSDPVIRRRTGAAGSGNALLAGANRPKRGRRTVVQPFDSGSRRAGRPGRAAGRCGGRCGGPQRAEFEYAGVQGPVAEDRVHASGHRRRLPGVHVEKQRAFRIFPIRHLLRPFAVRDRPVAAVYPRCAAAIRAVFFPRDRMRSVRGVQFQIRQTDAVHWLCVRHLRSVRLSICRVRLRQSVLIVDIRFGLLPGWAHGRKTYIAAHTR